MNLILRCILIFIWPIGLISCQPKNTLMGVEQPKQEDALKKLKPLYKEYLIPKMIPIAGGTITIPKSEGGSGDFSIGLGNYFVSEGEITVEQYCSFLNTISENKEKVAVEKWVKLGVQIVEEQGSCKPVNPKISQEPITSVSWYGAKEYASWVTRVVNEYRQKESLYILPSYRLLLEVEWFWAATQAKSNNKLAGFTNEVGEWCEDPFSNSLQNAEIERTRTRGMGTFPPNPKKIIRIRLGENFPDEMEKYRFPLLPEETDPRVGFRVGMSDMNLNSIINN